MQIELMKLANLATNIPGCRGLGVFRFQGKSMGGVMTTRLPIDDQPDQDLSPGLGLRGPPVNLCCGYG